MKEKIMLEKGLTNRFLLSCNEGYLLVEGGSQKEFSLFMRQLKGVGIDPKEIQFLFLSHHHEDHAGFAASLRKVSSCRIIMHSEALKPLQKGEHFVPGGGLVNRRALVFSFYALLKGVRFRLEPLELNETDIIVREDDHGRLRSLGIPGEILVTPGHSPDSISLLLDDGSCFCGDAAMNGPAWLGNRYCCIFISDVKQYYNSWQKMIKKGARTIYPAHGFPFSYQKLQKNLNSFSQHDLCMKK